MFPSVDYRNYNSISNEFTKDIQEKLKDAPIVVLDHIDLNENEFLELTRKLGEPINLPDLLVPAKLPGYPEIARVANFDQNEGNVDLKYAFGNYWHHDGNFWPPGQNKVINLLHSKIVPQKGGNTGFIDTRKAYDKLDVETKAQLAGVKVQVDLKNIEDFRNVPDSVVNQLGLPPRAEHDIIQIGDRFKSLYLPYYSGTINFKGKDWAHQELFDLLLSGQDLFYSHSWTDRQIVVWDNTQCMHKAMGGIGGKRLLWRSQARVH